MNKSKDFGLTMTANRILARPDGRMTDLAEHYQCVLAREGTAAVVYYSHGEGRAPSLWEVMHALVWDDQYLDYCDDPDDLEKELGVDDGVTLWEQLEQVRETLETLFPDIGREELFQAYGIPF